MIERNEFKLQGKTAMGRAVFKPPFKAHSALENEARFVTVVSGHSRLFVPNSQVNIEAGDSFLMKCESFMNQWLPNEDGGPTEVIIIHLNPEMLKLIYDDRIPAVFSKKVEANPSPMEKIEQNEVVAHFREGLRYYFKHPSLVTEEFIKIKIRELIHMLMNGEGKSRIRAILGDLFRSNEYEFKEIIHSHLFEDLKLQDLAFFAGLGLSTFKRKFKSVFGTSPTQYIKQKRLEKAENLLKTTDLRISDIAYDCGFNDVAYFSKAFSSTYSASPSQFRKKALGDFSN